MPVDLSGQIYDAFRRTLAQAKLRFQEGRYPEAAAAYRQCAHYLERYAGYAKSADIRKRWLHQAKEYRGLAERIEAGNFVLPAAMTTEAGTATEADYEAAVTALIHKSQVSWDDIAGLEDTKREVKAAYGLALATKPPGVRLEGWRNILFYGPPGTGKTLLAAATSRSLDATFFNVRVSDLLSKYFGESTKLVSALYSVARRLAPSVIFLDEFEALSPSRDGTQSGAEARIVSTFLSELDGLAQKGSQAYVLTIAATNVPWLIDKAILSRFEKLIYIPLPDAAARHRILELEIKHKGHRSEVPYDELTTRTEGYSGREVSQLAREAIKEMVTRVNPDLVAAVDRGREAAARYKVRTVPLSREDWERAFERVMRRTTEEEIRRFTEWRRRLK